MNISTISELALIFAAIGIVIYTFSNRHRIARFIPVSHLGIIERDLKNLRTVIVLADRIEKPSGALEDAVENNFSEKVHYMFLVSQKRAEKEINGYFLIFKALAQKAISEMTEPIEIKSLISIRKLTYDWPDVPYIFYQYEKNPGEISTIAFRGNQRGEGIADAYEQLKDSHSLAIASALLAAAPEEITADLNIVPISPYQDLECKNA